MSALCVLRRMFTRGEPPPQMKIVGLATTAAPLCRGVTPSVASSTVPQISATANRRSCSSSPFPVVPQPMTHQQHQPCEWMSALASYDNFYSQHSQSALLREVPTVAIEVVHRLLQRNKLWAAAAVVAVMNSEDPMFSVVRWRCSVHTQNWIASLRHLAHARGSRDAEVFLMNEDIKRVAILIGAPRSEGSHKCPAHGLSGSVLRLLLHSVQARKSNTLVTLEEVVRCCAGKTNWRFGLHAYYYARHILRSSPSAKCRDAILSSLVYGGQYEKCIAFSDLEGIGSNSTPQEVSAALLLSTDNTPQRFEGLIQRSKQQGLDLGSVQMILWALNHDKSTTWQTAIEVYRQQGVKSDELCTQRLLDSLVATKQFDVAGKLFCPVSWPMEAVWRFLNHFLPKCDWHIACAIVTATREVDIRIPEMSLVSVMHNVESAGHWQLAIAISCDGTMCAAAEIAARHNQWEAALVSLLGHRQVSPLDILRLVLTYIPSPNPVATMRWVTEAQRQKLSSTQRLEVLVLPRWENNVDLATGLAKVFPLDAFDFLSQMNYDAGRYKDNVGLLVEGDLPPRVRTEAVAAVFGSCVLHSSLKGRHDLLRLLIARAPGGAKVAVASIFHTLSMAVATHALPDHSVGKILLSMDTLRTHLSPSMRAWAHAATGKVIVTDPVEFQLHAKMRAGRHQDVLATLHQTPLSLRSLSQYELLATLASPPDEVLDVFTQCVAAGYHASPYLAGVTVAAVALSSASQNTGGMPAPAEIITQWLAPFPAVALCHLIEALLDSRRGPLIDRLASQLAERLPAQGPFPIDAWRARGMWQNILTYTGNATQAMRAATSWEDALCVWRCVADREVHPSALQYLVRECTRAGQWTHAVLVTAHDPPALADTLVKSAALGQYRDGLAWEMLNQYGDHGWLRNLTTFHVFMAHSVREGRWVRCLETLEVMRRLRIRPDPPTCLLLLRLCGLCRITADVLVNVKHRRNPKNTVMLTTTLRQAPQDAWMIATTLYQAAMVLHKRTKSSEQRTLRTEFQTHGVHTLRKCLRAGQWEVASGIFQKLPARGEVDHGTCTKLVSALEWAGQWCAASAVILEVEQNKPPLTKVQPHENAVAVLSFEERLTLCVQGDQDWCGAIEAWRHVVAKDVVLPITTVLGVIKLVASRAPCWFHAARLLSQVGTLQKHVLVNAKAVDAVVDACTTQGAWCAALQILQGRGISHSPTTIERVILLLLRVGFTGLSVQLLLHISSRRETIVIARNTERLVHTLVQHCATWDEAISVVGGCVEGMCPVPDSAMERTFQLCDQESRATWRVAFALYNLLRLMGVAPQADAVILSLLSLCVSANRWDAACRVYALHGIHSVDVAAACGTALCVLGKSERALGLTK